MHARLKPTALDARRLSRWAQGYGAVRHNKVTQTWVRQVLEWLAHEGIPSDGGDPLERLEAADRLANAGMWLVVHLTYAARVRRDGSPLEAADFKASPQGHTGGALNMVPAYVGYLLANALTGTTRSWVMGQGHTVAAIDSVNLLTGNLTPEHAARYDLTEAGLTRFVSDFYSYRLNERGEQESPLGSHVNLHTAGGTVEGGYLGFVELQYVHMPLPGEQLVAFLSDGAFEEQRGSDWAPRWWRAEDSGLALPIMIFNGRRIDQRTTMSQGQGLPWFRQHLKLNQFDPMDFDGTDPAAFACMIIQGERMLAERGRLAREGKAAYPVAMPYGIACTRKGAGFYGAGSNDAHNLPLGANPRTDGDAALHFNRCAARLYVPFPELERARDSLRGDGDRPPERRHALADRDVRLSHQPQLPWREGSGERASPMDAIDLGFLAFVQANPHLRPRVGNPDEIRSNRMDHTLDALKHRVANPEPGGAEAVDGKVITALNEEAVICACLGNKGGINIAVTYEAFATKMLGALRQEIIWSDELLAWGREPGWISVPLVLTSHTYENGKNERSHQDPTLAEALLGEPSDVARVVFPADWNSAAAALGACYGSRGRIYAIVAPKTAVADVFAPEAARRLLEEGGARLAAAAERPADVLLSAVGAYQLDAALRAARRLAERGIGAAVNHLAEPARFRAPRNRREAAYGAGEAVTGRLFPDSLPCRVFVSHTRPEAIAGVLRPLDTGRQSRFLGYIGRGGTLDTPGMLWANHQSWVHVVEAAARVLDADPARFLDPAEMDALRGRRSPQGVVI